MNYMCVCVFVCFFMTEYYKCVLLSVNSGPTDAAKYDMAN